MKKMMLALGFIGLACGVFAGADDALLVFSTKGPDYYADGVTQVVDGECYALVWTRNGAAFGGIAADGKPVSATDKVVLITANAKGGRCPTVLFQIDAGLVANEYKDGTFGVYLLDTRDAGGKPSPVAADGSVARVASYGKVAGAAATAQAGNLANMVAAAEGGASATAGSVSAVPANAVKPKITAIRVLNDKVELKVTGLMGCLNYGVSAAAAPGAAAAPAADIGWGEGADKEATVYVPKAAGQNFFSVNRK